MKYKVVVFDSLSPGSDNDNYIDACSVISTITSALLQQAEFSMLPDLQKGDCTSIKWNISGRNEEHHDINFIPLACPKLHQSTVIFREASKHANMLIICLNSSDLKAIDQRMIETFFQNINFYRQGFGRSNGAVIEDIPLLFVVLETEQSSRSQIDCDAKLNLCKLIANPKSSSSNIIKVDGASSSDFKGIAKPFIDTLTNKATPKSTMLLNLRIRRSTSPPNTCPGSRGNSRTSSPTEQAAMPQAACGWHTPPVASPPRGMYVNSPLNGTFACERQTDPTFTARPSPRTVGQLSQMHASAAAAVSGRQSSLNNNARRDCVPSSPTLLTATFFNIENLSDTQLPDKLCTALRLPNTVDLTNPNRCISVQSQVWNFKRWEEQSGQFKILDRSTVLIAGYDFSKKRADPSGLITAVHHLITTCLKCNSDRRIILVLLNSPATYDRELIALQNTLSSSCVLDIMEIHLEPNDATSNIAKVQTRVEEILKKSSAKNLSPAIYETLSSRPVKILVQYCKPYENPEQLPQQRQCVQGLISHLNTSLEKNRVSALNYYLQNVLDNFEAQTDNREISDALIVCAETTFKELNEPNFSNTLGDNLDSIYFSLYSKPAILVLIVAKDNSDSDSDLQINPLPLTLFQNSVQSKYIVNIVVIFKTTTPEGKINFISTSDITYWIEYLCKRQAVSQPFLRIDSTSPNLLYRPPSDWNNDKKPLDFFDNLFKTKEEQAKENMQTKKETYDKWWNEHL